MERIVIETDAETKKDLHELAHREEKSMKQLINEAIKNILKRLK